MALDPNLRRILQTHQHDIVSNVQLQHLLPILRNLDLASDEEFETLSSAPTSERCDKNRRMVDIILQKGKDAFDLFVKALESEHHHIGHKSLAETLQAAKKDSRKLSQPSTTLPTRFPGFFTPPCPRASDKRFTQQAPGLSILSHVNPRRHSAARSNSTSNERQLAENQDEPKRSNKSIVSDQSQITKLQSEESKVELTVKSNQSELPKPFSTVNPNKKMDARMTSLENDVKATKQNIEETKKLFNMAFETLHDKIEKLCSQNYEVDDRDVNQDVTITKSKQETRIEVIDNDYVEDGGYMVPASDVNKNAVTHRNKQPQPHPQHSPHPQRPQYHDYDNIPTDDIHKKSNSNLNYTPLLDENRDDDREYTKLTRKQGEGYGILKKLEEGESGHFWLAGKDKNRVVVKEGKTKEIITQEMNALKRLRPDHPNVVRVVHVELEDPKLTPSLTLTFEYAVNKNLRGYLKTKRRDFSDRHLLKIAIDVANGMKELERCNVIHCDLRAHNIIVFGDMTCKVASLNKALCLKHCEIHRICQSQTIAIRWQPPEVLKERKFSVKSDVWAFGVLLSEIFTFSSPPYPDMNKEQVKSNVMSGKKMPQPVDCPEEVHKIMRTCFKFSATERPSFYSLHQQLQNIQTKKYSSETEFD